MSKPTVFISYSHQDEAWKDRLVTHLSVLQRQGLLDPWDDRRISAGEDWRREIREAMNRASVAVLLVSANFLTSQFILSEEVPRLLQRRDGEGLRVFPVIARPCAWRRVKWLARMQVRPRDGRPLSAGDEHRIDADLAAIAEEVADVIEHTDRTAIPSGEVSEQKGNGTFLIETPSRETRLIQNGHQRRLPDDGPTHRALKDAFPTHRKPDGELQRYPLGKDIPSTAPQVVEDQEGVVYLKRDELIIDGTIVVEGTKRKIDEQVADYLTDGDGPTLVAAQKLVGLKNLPPLLADTVEKMHNSRFGLIKGQGDWKYLKKDPFIRWIRKPDIRDGLIELLDLVSIQSVGDDELDSDYVLGPPIYRLSDSVIQNLLKWRSTSQRVISRSAHHEDRSTFPPLPSSPPEPATRESQPPPSGKRGGCIGRIGSWSVSLRVWYGKLPAAQQVAIIVALIGLIGTLAAAFIGVMPELLSRPTPTVTPTPTATPAARSTMVDTYPFYVYRNNGSPDNHFSFWDRGIWEDGGSVGWGNQIDYGYSDNCLSGSTCMCIAYTPVGPKYWVGINWLHPPGNYGAKEGFNLEKATRLTFWARGKKGGEVVTFAMGGLGRDADTCDPLPDVPYPDSVCPTIEISPTLGTNWQQYSIDLAGKDLSHVIRGFFVSIGGGITHTIHLDEIRYESGQPTITATATFTPTTFPTQTATLALTPTPTCAVAATTDAKTLFAIINAEAQAVLGEDIELIKAIFASDAIIRNEATDQEWGSPEVYYTEKFQNEIHCRAEHYDYHIQKLTSEEALVTTANRGEWGWEAEGCTMTYENPSGADRWHFRKDTFGCWQIVRFTYNAHTQ